MGRRLRFIPPGGYLVEVTNRTIQGRFLLRPGRQLNELLIGVLGRAQRLFGVRIHAFIVLSNHYHLLISVDSALQMAQFMGYFQSNLAREAGRLHNWRGPFWHRRYQHVLVSDEEAAQVERLHYILSNSCKENLVSSPLQWPGASSIRALLFGEEVRGIWIDRTRKRRSSRQGRSGVSRFRKNESVEVSPLPCWKRLDRETRRLRARELVTRVEAETNQRHRIENTRPLGASRILGLDPHDKPTSSKSSSAPLFHCVSKQVRSALREAYGLFCSTFHQAADRMRSMDSPFEFPEGAFPPALPFQHPIRAPG